MRNAPDLGDVLGLVGRVSWGAQVLAQLSACLRVIVDDLAAHVDPAETSRRWVQRLRAVIATIERVEEAPTNVALPAEAAPTKTFDIPDDTPAWDFGSAIALLTERQADVVHLLLVKFRPAQIAESLGIAEATVYTHRRDAVKRLRMDGSPGALRLARRCSHFERTLPPPHTP